MKRTFLIEKSTRRWRLSFVIAAVLSSIEAASAQQYVLTDIGDLGSIGSTALGVNNLGQVVGVTTVSEGESSAFLWSAAGGLQIIAPPSSGASAINDAGQVVGDATFSPGESEAFLWSPSGGLVNLGNLGLTPSGARSINRAGHIVGYSQFSGFTQHSFLWTSSTGMQDLGGSTSNGAAGINDSDQLAATIGGIASLWTSSGGFQTLGTLGGTRSVASGINNNVQIVGRSNRTNTDVRPFFWSSATGMVDLGNFGGRFGEADQINDSGVVVGASNDSGNISHAFMWTASGGFRDLNSLVDPSAGMFLTHAWGISNTGLIVGQGSMSDGTNHGFMLTPVPEPVSLVGMVFGLLAIRRRKRARTCLG